MSRNDRGVSPLIIILCVALVLAGLIAAYILLRNPASSGSASGRAGPSAEQKAYFASLEFSDLHMSAAENFLGTTVTYLDGRVTNKGTKTLRRLDVELNFVDVLNQVVLRETAFPVTRRSPPLHPGETRSFRVIFEHMPMDWNQAPPAIKPVSLEF
jgi:hypothetical protein